MKAILRDKEVNWVHVKIGIYMVFVGVPLAFINEYLGSAIILTGTVVYCLMEILLGGDRVE